MNKFFAVECLINNMKKNTNSKMFKVFSSLLFSLVLTTAITEQVKAEEALPLPTQQMMGFDAKSDLKIGPIMKVGFPVVGSDSRVTYTPNVSLDIHGESLLFGTTGFSFNWISSSRNFTTNVPGKTTFSEVGPTNASKITKNLLMLTLVSPINYTPESKLEFGWQGGIFSQFVSLDNNISGDTNSNIGVNAGTYIKDYHFYPFVPYVNGKILLGNMYDNGKTIQQNTLSSSIKAGYFLSGGFDLYLTKQVVINVGYNLMNPDFFTLSPTTATPVAAGQTNNQPADDSSFSFAENVQTVNGSIGFLF